MGRDLPRLVRRPSQGRTHQGTWEAARLPAHVVDTSLTGHRVVGELNRIAEERGYPCVVVSSVPSYVGKNLPF